MTNIKVEFEQCAVKFEHGPNTPGRRYWVAWWLGMFVGPLVMACTRYKSIKFGVQRGDKWSWWECN